MNETFSLACSIELHRWQMAGEARRSATLSRSFDGGRAIALALLHLRANCDVAVIYVMIFNSNFKQSIKLKPLSRVAFQE